MVVAISACAQRGTVAKLPDAPPIELSAISPMLPAEQTSWSVFLGSVQIGRAHLVVDARTARSEFATNALASIIEPVRYQLVTLLDRRAAREIVTTGATKTYELGERASLHTALGVLRAWSLNDPRPGYLWLAHQGDDFRLDVFAPERDEAFGIRALRIDGVVRSRDGSVTTEVALWLAANADRTPLRLVIGSGRSRLSAEISESTGSFDP